MTAQEAIKRLQYERAAREYHSNLNEVFDMAIEALEKQIPKKPIKINETYVVERGEWVADYECPSCGNPYADDSYCSCCGQKLDWGDGE